jgi:BlaI family transcriptional regulator, penicillinase repressor
MMARSMKALPTDAELAILNVLWSKGSATVREVHEALGEADTGYTTVLKTMQIMTQKGLVSRDESERSHVYRAAVNQEPTQRRLLRDLIDRAFGGSAPTLAMRALSVAPASKEELAEVRALLDELERGRRK